MAKTQTLSDKLRATPFVCYILPDEGHPHLTGTAGQVRPAIVVRDWSNPDIPDSDGVINLQVFLDGSNDAGIDAINAARVVTLWKTSVHYSNDLLPGTWHFYGDAPVDDTSASSSSATAKAQTPAAAGA